MVFSSSIFLVYFLPCFLVVYFLIPKSLKNIFLLIASICFYAWGAPKFIFAILGTTTLDFFLVKTMYHAKTPKQQKLFLILSLCLNVGMLFYFKYCNFFIENFNDILQSCGVQSLAWTKVVLPIGISFYTFESLTYVIDVYRREHKPLDNFWHYQLYIILFPKLIAGPIIRYHDISDQITNRFDADSVDNKLAGFYRFVIGLCKKVLIANVLAAKADEVFGMPLDAISCNIAWIGALSYTFQIYFDFSGYSDMAIGIGKMLGFKFPENFNNPYNAGSITEFWRRWHITLGSWMKNYLYIPLGGNKVSSNGRLYFNLWLVFILSGFWHGAAWTFIFWGIYHGIFLILERMFLLNLYKKMGRFIPVVITFVIASIGWIFFRADSFAFAKGLTLRLFSFDYNATFILDDEFKFYFILAVFFSFFGLFKFGERIQTFFYNKQYTNLQVAGLSIFALMFYFICLGAITASSFNPFIYFRF
jgi:alginate O-acetyltransferase complex protein AlgI